MRGDFVRARELIEKAARVTESVERSSAKTGTP